MAKKVCVVLGAGASHDVWNQGSARPDPQMGTLPLANDLFNLEKNPGYQAYLDPYPGADYLSSLIAPQITSAEVGVEQALTAYATHDSAELRAMYSEVPAYLRDLTHRLTQNYLDLNVRRRPGCYDQLVATLLGDHEHEALFIVLNYDTLLENSLSAFYPGRIFERLGHYVSNDYRANVLKVHGSTNWFWSLPRTLSEIIRQVQVDGFNPDYLQVDDSVDRVGERELYPAVTAPVARGKRLVCPKTQLDFAREFISECRKFLIIGTSGYDQDVIELLGTSMSGSLFANRVRFVSYAGKDESGTWKEGERERVEGAWKRFSNGVLGFRNSEVDTSYDGFREYVSSEAFQAFASAGTLG